MFGYRDTFAYLECSQCGCLQSKSRPEDLSRYYGAAYYSMASQASLRRPFYEALKRSRTRAFLGGSSIIGHGLLKTFGPPGLPNWIERAGMRQESSLLEVGCGSGQLLRLMASEGFRNLAGVDLYIDKDLNPAPGVFIRKAQLGEIDGHYDFVVLEHSLEHLPDPYPTINKLQSLLAGNGTLIISIPLAAYAWNRYGVNWVQLDAPRHLYLHSERSFRLLCRDMEITEVVYDSGAFQFWGSEQYAMDIPLLDNRSYRINSSNSIFSPQQIADFQRQANNLNEIGQGDQATFYIRNHA